jgi:hypothetical protein
MDKDIPAQRAMQARYPGSVNEASRRKKPLLRDLSGSGE